MSLYKIRSGQFIDKFNQDIALRGRRNIFPHATDGGNLFSISCFSVWRCIKRPSSLYHSRVVIVTATIYCVCSVLSTLHIHVISNPRINSAQ